MRVPLLFTLCHFFMPVSLLFAVFHIFYASVASICSAPLFYASIASICSVPLFYASVASICSVPLFYATVASLCSVPHFLCQCRFYLQCSTFLCQCRFYLQCSTFYASVASICSVPLFYASVCSTEWSPSSRFILSLLINIQTFGPTQLFMYCNTVTCLCAHLGSSSGRQMKTLRKANTHMHTQYTLASLVLCLLLVQQFVFGLLMMVPNMHPNGSCVTIHELDGKSMNCIYQHHSLFHSHLISSPFSIINSCQESVVK